MLKIENSGFSSLQIKKRFCNLQCHDKFWSSSGFPSSVFPFALLSVIKQPKLEAHCSTLFMRKLGTCKGIPPSSCKFQWRRV